MSETAPIAAQENLSEDRASFHARLNKLGLYRGNEIFEKIDAAYDYSKVAHGKQFRATGERYFEHPRSVTLILLDECGITDPNIIMAALLHDSVEDSPLFANRTQAHSEWEQIAYTRLRAQFNHEVAAIIISVTKPAVDWKELKSKDEAQEYYLKNLIGLAEKITVKIILVKMADRLHNLRTSKTLSDAKKKKIIAETEDEYFPIFEKFWSTYKTAKADEEINQNFALAGENMFQKMKQEIEELRNSP